MAIAAPMPDGGQMSAYLFAGRHDAANDPAAYDDYYRFTAQPGALSIRLDDVPADVAARLFLFRTDGSEVARVSTGLRGGALAMNAPAVTQAAELHRPRVAVGGGAGRGRGRNRATDELHAAYRLSVSQSPPRLPSSTEETNSGDRAPSGTGEPWNRGEDWARVERLLELARSATPRS